jgi:hypothetical protein
VVRTLLTPLRDPQTWLDALHALIRFPLAILGFVVTVVLWSIALTGLTYGAYDWTLPNSSTDPENQDLLEVLGHESTAGRRIPLSTTGPSSGWCGCRWTSRAPSGSSTAIPAPPAPR